MTCGDLSALPPKIHLAEWQSRGPFPPPRTSPHPAGNKPTHPSNFVLLYQSSTHQTPPAGKGYPVSRKKRRQGKTAEETTVPEPAPAAGPELLRRYLLGLLTALIVARPFILGEDPGIVAALTDTSNLVITLLWIVAAVGWASWRAWSGRGAWYGGVVEAGLLATVVLVFTGAASVARYKHPAQLIGWEWLVLFLALFLVRQLAVTDEDRRGLLTAALATVVVLSGYRLYQSATEKPEARDKSRASLEGQLTDRQHLGLLAVGPAGAVLREQVRATREAEDLIRADLVA